MGESELYYRDATEPAELIAGRQVSAMEVVRARLDRIAAVDPKINAVTVTAERALDAARTAEATILRLGAALEEISPVRHRHPYLG
ncbi:hypothetical protein [Streptomyces sp. OE57]|uniref:hypothetical protein n=1 Tax=Streptomyces lacaronensis TaxID=3379885 RepID=UPI0039B7256C